MLPLWTWSLSRCIRSIQSSFRGVFRRRVLSENYDGTVLWKQLTAKNYELSSPNSSIIDIWLGYKKTSLFCVSALEYEIIDMRMNFFSKHDKIFANFSNIFHFLVSLFCLNWKCLFDQVIWFCSHLKYLRKHKNVFEKQSFQKGFQFFKDI